MKRGRKRRIDHDAIVDYALAHPEALQSEIATLFQTSQCRVSEILRTAGVDVAPKGRQPKQKDGQTDEQYKWELILSRAGYGMDRGARLNNQSILYGYDSKLETCSDSSATNF